MVGGCRACCWGDPGASADLPMDDQRELDLNSQRMAIQFTLGVFVSDKLINKCNTRIMFISISLSKTSKTSKTSKIEWVDFIHFSNDCINP